MMPSRVLRVTGEQMKQYFDQSKETTELRAVIAEHILDQHRARYSDLHRTTPRERYDLLMQRCPGIVEHLDLQDIALLLRSTFGRFAMQRTSTPTPSARFAKKSRFEAGEDDKTMVSTNRPAHPRPLCLNI